MENEIDDDAVVRIVAKNLRDVLKLLASDETPEGKMAYDILMDSFKLSNALTVDPDL